MAEPVEGGALLARHFPGRAGDAFEAMRIGPTPASRDDGVRLILSGRKTLTGSRPWEWDGARAWFLRETGAHYAAQSAAAGRPFGPETPVIFERFRVALPLQRPSE